MGNATTLYDYLLEFYYYNFDYELLGYITHTKEFRRDVDNLRQSDPTQNKEGLLRLGLPRSIVYAYLLVFTPGSARGSLEPSRDLSNIGGIRRVLKKLHKYESSVNENELHLGALLTKYALGKGFRRRVRSILMYDDYPQMEDFMYKRTSREIDFLDYEFITTDKDPSNWHVSIKLYSDTPVKLLSKKEIEGLKSELPAYRHKKKSRKSNLERDSIALLLRERGLSFSKIKDVLEKTELETFGITYPEDVRSHINKMINRQKDFTSNTVDNSNIH